ncbi:MAG: M50 family metallopeptidase [Acutalibacteraceae bacterium]|nr:M50 family metallopeptidase [Acutalibacteraceae bacterium]
MNNFKTVSDIKPYLLYTYKNKDDVYAVGSIERDRFIEVKEPDVEPIMLCITLLNKGDSINTIQETVQKDTKRCIDVEKLCELLERANLLEESDASKIEKNELDVLSLKIVDIETTKLQKFLNVCSKGVVALFGITIISFIFSILYGDVYSIVTDSSLLGFTSNYILNFFIMFSISLLSLLLHEFAHGIVAARYNLNTNNFIVSLYLYVSPLVYLKIPGMYTVKPKERVAIWSAGVTCNLFLFSLGLIFFTFCNNIGAPEYMISIFKYVCNINLMLIVSNLSPLLPLDGYFTLATLLKVPNLRKKSFKNIGKILSGKNVKIKATYFLYFGLSSIIMAIIFVREIFAMVMLFIDGFNQGGIFAAFWNIKLYILLIIVLLVIRVVKEIKKD